MDRSEGATPRYRAFISYSHRDAAFGRRLHGRLERYVLPRRLVGRPGRLGPVPARLSPIFRDREELSAAGDLSAEVRAALAQSAVLVVVCSPAAAASVWVGREIETFRALHPDRPVLVALAAGNPGEAFPAALFTDGGEPLAADFRREGDGPRLALLKLAAGIVGVGLDELVQRDAQRRIARVTAVTAVAVAAMLAMSVLTFIALTARAEAERQRAEAEGLVEFMLTDLRDRLKGVGRLDVMTTVNQRALAHYDQDPRALTPAQLVQRAAVLHAMSEDDLTRGDLEAASAAILEARQMTAGLLARAPNDPARIYAQAQNEFWLGYVAYERKDYQDAQARFEAYRALAGRLVVMDPRNPVYRRELGYAEGDLCNVAGFGFQDMKATLRHCLAGYAAMEIAARARPDDIGIQKDLINRQGWLADAWRANGDWARARDLRLAQERAVNRLLAADPKDVDLKETWIATQRALVTIAIHDDQMEDARRRLAVARREIAGLVALDPGNPRRASLSAALDRQSRSISLESN